MQNKFLDVEITVQTFLPQPEWFSCALRLLHPRDTSISFSNGKNKIKVKLATFWLLVDSDQLLCMMINCNHVKRCYEYLIHIITNLYRGDESVVLWVRQKQEVHTITNIWDQFWLQTFCLKRGWKTCFEKSSTNKITKLWAYSVNFISWTWHVVW